MYKVLYSEKALKALKKMDKGVATLILAWVRKNLDNSIDPRTIGKALTADHSGEWRYRVGDYRILAHISDVEITIRTILHSAPHRGILLQDK